MKHTHKLIAFSLLLFFLFFGKHSFSQENKVIAEVHNLLVDNTSKDKIIQIRFLNCSKSEFEDLYKKSLQSSNLVFFRKAYSSEDQIASIHYTKSSDITTSDVRVLLQLLGIKNLKFNGKNILTGELPNYHFVSKDKSNNSDRIEK